MKRLLLSFAIALFCQLMYGVDIASSPNLTSLPGFAMIEPLQPLESVDAATVLSEEKFKELKKLYKAKSITYELWPGGNRYYVLHKKNMSAMLNEEFEPILLGDFKNKPLHYVYKLSPAYYDGEGYIFAAHQEHIVPAFYTSTGSNIFPMKTFGEVAGFIMNDEKMFVGLYDKDDVYNFGIGVEGGLWHNGDGSSFRFYPATQDGYVDSGLGMRYWAPAHPDFFYMKSYSGKDLICYINPELEKKYCTTQKATVLPGGGYILYSPGKTGRPDISVQNVTRDLGNGETGEFTEMVITSELPRINKMRISDIKLKNYLADGVDRVILSDPDQVAFIIKYDKKNKWRRGAVDLTNPSCRVEPRFNSVFFYEDAEGKSTPWVKTSAFSPVVPADSIPEDIDVMPTNRIDSLYEIYSSDVYQMGPYKGNTPPYTIVITEINNEIKKDSVSDTHLSMYLTCLLNDADFKLENARSYLTDYYNMINPANDRVRKNSMEFDSTGRPSLPSFVPEVLKLNVERLKKLNDEGKYPDSTYVQATIDHINNVITEIEYLSVQGIGEAYDAYMAKVEAQRRAEMQRQAEIARQIQREREERLSAAIVNALFSVGTQIISNATKPKAKTYAKTSGFASSASGGGASSAGSDSSKADRKAFLKREIIELENRTKKAKAAYEQTIENWSTNGSWESKRAMESKKDTYEMYQSKLDAYKEELKNL